MTIRMIELFAGIGATHEAMTELGLDVEIVGISEIDRHAIKGYEAIHGKVNVLGDITKIDHLPECDLITYSWPCQSVSIAGMKAGMVEGSGTESSLLWEVGRLLKDMRERDVLPEYLVAENVDAVLNKLNIGEFRRWIMMLSELGYTSSYRIMNAKDYGTPQNRRRMFMVSTLTHGSFVFPRPCPDGRILRDILEDDVDESYFLSEKRIATFEKHRKRNEANGNKFGWRVHVLTDEAREREGGRIADGQHQTRQIQSDLHRNSPEGSNESHRIPMRYQVGLHDSRRRRRIGIGETPQGTRDGSKEHRAHAYYGHWGGGWYSD